MEDLTAYLRRKLQGQASLEARIKAAVRSHVRFHLNRQKETFIANSELRGLTPEHYQHIVALRDEYEQIIQSIIRAGCDSGLFVGEDFKILSYAVLTLCNAGAIWFKPDGRLPVDAIADLYAAFVWRGLKGGGLDDYTAAPLLPCIGERR